MLSDRSKKWIVGAGVFVLFCITLAGLFIPHKFREIETSEVNTYKVIWALWGIAQIMLTIALTYLIITLFSKDTKKVEYYVQVVVMLCIAVMWLLIVVKPVISILKRNEKIVHLKLADIGKDKSVCDGNEIK